MTTSRSSGSRAGRRAPAPRPAAPTGPAEPRARALALRLLAVRARTEAQLRARLERDGLGEQAAPVLAWLRGLGYLDDERYARARARTLTAPGRLGPRGAERRLLAEGVERALARGAVEAALDEAPGGEAERCRALALRRAGGQALAALDDRARARLVRFLLGRGFSGAVVAGTLGGFDDRELGDDG